MKRYLIITITVILLGCGGTKEVVKTSVMTSDTLVMKTEIIKAPVLNQSLVIEEICDTITGQVVRFKKIFVRDGDSIQVLTDVNNNLHVNIRQKESTLSEKDSIIRSLRSQIHSSSEIVRVKKDWRWICGALILGLVIGLVRPWRLLNLL